MVLLSHTTIKELPAWFENGDRNACVQEVHADTATMVPANRHFLNIALGGVRARLRLAGSTLYRTGGAVRAIQTSTSGLMNHRALVRQAISNLRQ